LLTFTSGDNSTLDMEVKKQTFISGSSHKIELFEKMPFAIDVGDTLSITAGCDKLIATCKTKFNNIVNFRGFPTIPGPSLGTIESVGESKTIFSPDNFKK
jgi:uncharacterized phage protein (TIGR02218 family)